LGNHEDKLLRYLAHAKSKKKNPISLDKDEQNIIVNLTSEHIKYLKNLPIYLKYKGVTIVHGGVQNSMNLDKLSKRAKQKVMRIRYLDRNKRFVANGKENSKSIFWADVYDGKQGFIVYGHQRLSKVKKNKHSIGIDTGCTSGNKLTAAIFKNYKIDSLSIKSVKFIGSK